MTHLIHGLELEYLSMSFSSFAQLRICSLLLHKLDQWIKPYGEDWLIKRLCVRWRTCWFQIKFNVVSKWSLLQHRDKSVNPDPIAMTELVLPQRRIGFGRTLQCQWNVLALWSFPFSGSICGFLLTCDKNVTCVCVIVSERLSLLRLRVCVYLCVCVYACVYLRVCVCVCLYGSVDGLSGSPSPQGTALVNISDKAHYQGSGDFSLIPP